MATATRTRWLAELAAGIGDPNVWPIPRRFWNAAGCLIPQGVGIEMPQPRAIEPQQQQAILPVRNPRDFLRPRRAALEPKGASAAARATTSAPIGVELVWCEFLH